MTHEPTRLLVIEDDSTIARYLAEILTAEGFRVDVAESGADGERFASSHSYEVIVLDLMLPDTDGFELLDRLRKAGNESGVIILSARADLDDRVRGLDVGADDYLVKPFRAEELAARIRAVLRRRTQPALAITSGPFQILRLERKVLRDGVAIDLTSREFDLFSYFIASPGQTLTRAMIAQDVWGVDFDTGTNVIDVYVNYLRRKLGQPGEKFFVAVRGVGYRFDPDAEDPGANS